MQNHALLWVTRPLSRNGVGSTFSADPPVLIVTAEMPGYSSPTLATGTLSCARAEAPARRQSAINRTWRIFMIGCEGKRLVKIGVPPIRSLPGIEHNFIRIRDG